MQTDATPPHPRAHPSALRTLISLVATGRSEATPEGSAAAAIQVRSERDENRRQHRRLGEHEQHLTGDDIAVHEPARRVDDVRDRVDLEECFERARAASTG